MARNQCLKPISQFKNRSHFKSLLKFWHKWTLKFTLSAKRWEKSKIAKYIFYSDLCASRSNTGEMFGAGEGNLHLFGFNNLALFGVFWA
jgi:hypothetical protein